jgi:methylmalonyl-CoA/ethylmalonyl-CoA epimerase
MEVKTTIESKDAPVSKPATLHHVGFVVASISESAQSFAQSIGADWEGEVIYDPLQDARVAFLSHRVDTCAPMIELVEPGSDASPLHRFLKDGGGLHHLCYEVDSLREELHRSRSSGALVVKQPLPAAAFGGRLIAWVYTGQKLLVEYLER